MVIIKKTAKDIEMDILPLENIDLPYWYVFLHCL